MKKSLLMAAIALLTAVGAHAAAPGYYAGVSVGEAHSDFSTAANQTGTTGQITLGYNYTPVIGAEVSYARLGNVTLNDGTTAEQSSLTVAGLAHHNVYGKLDGFAKAGVSYTKLTDGSNDFRWAPMVGVGVEYPVTAKVSVRAEVQYTPNFAGSSADVTHTSIGATYKF